LPRLFGSWLEFEQRKSDKPLSDDHHIMAPPYWPSVGQIKNWIELFNDAAKELQNDLST